MDNNGSKLIVIRQRIFDYRGRTPNMSNSERPSLERAHIVDDKGILFRHVSRQFGNDVTRNDHAVEINVLGTPPEHDTLKYNPFARELVLPEFYASLLEKKNEERSTATFIDSEVNVHEQTHYKLAKREQHWSFEAELSSFSAILAGLTTTFDDLANRLRTVAKSSNENFTQAQLLHEGLAISRQVSFLQEATSGDSLPGRLSWVDKTRSIERFLAENSSPETYLEEIRSSTPNSPILSSPEHAFGHWLYRRVKNKWTIDIADYAFRIAVDIEQNGDTTIGTLSPDTVLLIAAFTDQEELKKCETHTDEEQLLTARINKWASQESTNSEVQLPANANLEGDWEIKSRDEIRGQISERLLLAALESDDPYQFPLLATSYPGVEQGHNLWTILDNMFVYTDDQGVRRLFLDAAVADWASGTPLLEIATHLWRLRDLLFAPFFHAHNGGIKHDPRALLRIVKSEKPEQGIIEFEDDVAEQSAEDHFLARANQEIDSTACENLISELARLGRAIQTQNESVVQQYFSK